VRCGLHPQPKKTAIERPIPGADPASGRPRDFISGTIIPQPRQLRFPAAPRPPPGRPGGIARPFRWPLAVRERTVAAHPPASPPGRAPAAHPPPAHGAHIVTDVRNLRFLPQRWYTCLSGGALRGCPATWPLMGRSCDYACSACTHNHRYSRACMRCRRLRKCFSKRALRFRTASEHLG
jgi:hypothetical protein